MNGREYEQNERGGRENPPREQMETRQCAMLDETNRELAVP